MYFYNEKTEQWEDRPIHFTVNGVDRPDEWYNIMIPRRYLELFENHNFPSKDVLSRALMHAGCANEAYYYNRPWKVEEYERALKKCLEL